MKKRWNHVRLYEQLKAKTSNSLRERWTVAREDVPNCWQLDQQQQLTLQAMNDRDFMKLELRQANEKVQSKKAKVSGRAFSVDSPGGSVPFFPTISPWKH